MKKVKRICIYPKDVQAITGKSYRQSLRILQNLRKCFLKAEGSYVTVSEFSIYTGISEKDIERFLD